MVATSGNVSDEPICTREQEAVLRLQGIAALFLIHDRPIVRHVDDSLVRVMAGRELVLRRARGFAPLPVLLHEPVPEIVAVGAHQKNTIAASVGEQVFISQHIGDLENLTAYNAFEQVLADFAGLRTPSAVMAATNIPITSRLNWPQAGRSRGGCNAAPLCSRAFVHGRESD